MPNIGNAGSLEVTSAPATCIITGGGKTYTIRNVGTVTVFINFNGDAVHENETAEDGKVWLTQGQEWVTSQKIFTYATASSTSKLCIVERDRF